MGDLGFSIEQTRALLALSDDRFRDCATVDAIASAHLTEIDRKLADSSALRREIAALVETCQGGTINDRRVPHIRRAWAGRIRSMTGVQTVRGPSRITPAPTRQTSAPETSQRSGRTPSTAHSQSRDAQM